MMCFVIVVIEVQILTEEVLMNIDSVVFPSTLNTSSNDMFDKMAPMIRIPASILINQITEQGYTIRINSCSIIIIYYRKESCCG